MALSRPQTYFDRHTVRLIMDNDIDTYALKIAKASPDFRHKH